MKRLILSSLFSLLSIGQLYAGSNSREDAEQAERRRHEDAERAGRYALIPSLQQQCTNVLVNGQSLSPGQPTRLDLERADAQVNRIPFVAQGLRVGLQQVISLDTIHHDNSIDGCTQLQRIDKAEALLMQYWSVLRDRYAALLAEEAFAAQRRREAWIRRGRQVAIHALPIIALDAPQWIFKYVLKHRADVYKEFARALMFAKIKELGFDHSELSQELFDQAKDACLATLTESQEYKEYLQVYELWKPFDIWCVLTPTVLLAIGFVLARPDVRERWRIDRNRRDVGSALFAKGFAGAVHQATHDTIPRLFPWFGQGTATRYRTIGAPLLQAAIGAGMLIVVNRMSNRESFRTAFLEGSLATLLVSAVELVLNFYRN